MNFLQAGLLKLLPTTIMWLLLAYLGFKCLDMLLGILKAWKNNNYRSGKMRDGIVRWIAEIVAIVFVVVVDMVLGLNFYLCGFTLSLFVYKEAGSILENLTECGVEMPLAVKEKLEVFNKKESKVE
ncbi:phage holin family protein [Clostridium cadaveris]|uniref:Holin n=3 Tax=Clostridium cadaveris TaxID=1529 RepID=A0A1I2KQ14_9CLOT|nr:phage holin family protein [Clostridium cadaveris]NME66337.1 phage holin family protein [Clostridium cadaveris]PWL53266.1 MAG: holin [Clostridium cadaveris]UFH65599.1 phage holin family protein [Clostridium cadaveris]SFF68340.1 holin, Cph1 family [Clostridium cadaveris]